VAFIFLLLSASFIRPFNLSGLISSFFYKLRKNAFGIFPICSDGFNRQKSSQIVNLPALLFFLQKNSIFNLII